MNAVPQLLVFDAGHEPARALCARLAERGWAATQRSVGEAAEDPTWRAPDVAAIVTGDAVDEQTTKQTAALLDRLVTDQTATVVWGAGDRIRWAGGTRVEWLDPSASLDEVVGRLCALARYVPLVQQLERELNHIRRLGGQLNRYFSEIDQEMRLAGRLQRDFLPAHMPELPGLRCAALYRPASWVSGDLYDVFRIDERHVGLFIADAMGHGVAAGLMTMFLRQALTPKEISGSSYSLATPTDAMMRLHETLLRQRLPGCQFVTAVYALYDTQQRELRLSRAGHPHPLHVRANGAIEPIMSSGSLLGLPDIPAEFDEVRLTLQPGDKVLLYTDGLEDDFLAGGKNRAHPDAFTPALHEWAALPAAELVEALGIYLDSKEGSLHPADDVTLLALEVL